MNAYQSQIMKIIVTSNCCTYKDFDFNLCYSLYYLFNENKVSRYFRSLLIQIMKHK